MYENIIKIILIIISLIIISIFLIKRFVYFKPITKFLPYDSERYKDISEGNLYGWFIEGVRDKVILFCHGNKGNISTCQNEIDSLNKLGYSILIFDYSGYGKSKGVPSEKQFYHDANIFMRILLKKFNKNNIILYGESVGASVASYIALKYQTPKVIIISGIPSIKKIIENKYKYLSWFNFLFQEFDTEKYLKFYKGKVLIVHSLLNKDIPYESTINIRNRATLSIEIRDDNIPWNKIERFINSP